MKLMLLEHYIAISFILYLKYATLLVLLIPDSVHLSYMSEQHRSILETDEPRVTFNQVLFGLFIQRLLLRNYDDVFC